MIKAIFIIEWKGFYRTPLLIASYIFLLFTGLYAIHYGNKEIGKQRSIIQLVEEKGNRQFDSLLRGFAADTTQPLGKKAWRDVAEPRYSWYTQKYPVVFNPSPLAALSLGLRDIFPYYQELQSHSLYMQVFKSEISNPEKLLTGNLDLAFVLIFLFPLFIIGLGYDIVSGEKESGVYAVIKTQAVSFNKVVLVKLLFRFVLVALPAMVLCIIGKASLLWSIITLLYIAFWHTVVYFTASLNKNSAFNAMALVSVWLLFLIVLPALFNAIAIYRYPIDQTNLSNYIRRIQVDESKEGLNNLAKMYYEKYPALDDHDTTWLTLYKKAYPMAGEIGDSVARPVVYNYYKQIEARNRFVSRFNLVNPAVNTQQVFNLMACTDVNNFLQYQKALESFHRKLVKFYHEPLYLNKTFTPLDYNKKPAFTWNSTVSRNEINIGILILLAWTILLFATGYLKFSKGD
jgi:ABC-2 type transport system permease protein